MTNYICSKCNLTVKLEVDNEENIQLIKACSCDAPIIAEMVSDLTGTGGFLNEDQ